MDLTALISNVGFPIAVAIWLLTMGGKKIDTITTAIQNLTTVMEKQLTSNERDHKEFQAIIGNCSGNYGRRQSDIDRRESGDRVE